MQFSSGITIDFRTSYETHADYFICLTTQIDPCTLIFLPCTWLIFILGLVIPFLWLNVGLNDSRHERKAFSI